MPPDPTRPPHLLVNDISFRWDKKHPVCLAISAFAVEPGERVFLHGPSGCGKSTLLAMLGGILMPQQGQVRALGETLTDFSSRQRDQFRVDHIGFIFQQFNLIAYLSVFENVLLPCRFSARRRLRTCQSAADLPLELKTEHPHETTQSLEQEAVRLLCALGIKPTLHHRAVTTLSVGQQQRVAAARALIGSPEIIIADEPTSSLDAEQQVNFLELISKECHTTGASLLFVSHDHRLSAHFNRAVDLRSLNRAQSEGADA
jgi:putative ABC transport system ATP-binding protein